MTGTNSPQGADLATLQSVIAGSSIVVALPRARDFAEWCELQSQAEIDGVILTWIASHVPARNPAALS